MWALLCALLAPVGYWMCVGANETVWVSSAHTWTTARRAVVAYVYSARHLLSTCAKFAELAKNTASMALGERLQARTGAAPVVAPAAFDASLLDD